MKYKSAPNVCLKITLYSNISIVPYHLQSIFEKILSHLMLQAWYLTCSSIVTCYRLFLCWHSCIHTPSVKDFLTSFFNGLLNINNGLSETYSMKHLLQAHMCDVVNRINFDFFHSLCRILESPGACISFSTIGSSAD